MSRPRIAFVVNGGESSAMAERARSFAARLGEEFDCRVILRAGGKLGATARMWRALRAFRPEACYVLDIAAPGVLAAGLYKRFAGTPVVVDTGDAIVELGRALGRGKLATAATRALENFAFRIASAVVVRGRYHRELLAERGINAEFIPDGVHVDDFAAQSSPAKNDAGPLVIGIIGSSIWVPARQTCYGWELVELVKLLDGRLPRPVRGVLVGDGSGIERLKRRARELGVENLIDFPGRVPYDDLPIWLHRCAICLSTQTNDVIGRVRTTGKLPLYLAAGRFVLASNVGEAACVLPIEMRVDFAGESDPNYPQKLAARIEQLVHQGTDFSCRPECIALAREHFECDRLAERVRGVLRAVLKIPSPRPVNR